MPQSKNKKTTNKLKINSNINLNNKKIHRFQGEIIKLYSYLQ